MQCKRKHIFRNTCLNVKVNTNLGNFFFIFAHSLPTQKHEQKNNKYFLFCLFFMAIFFKLERDKRFF